MTDITFKRSYVYRDELFNVRLQIKQLSSMTTQSKSSDSELQKQKEDIAYAFFQVLQYCLNKQATDINIQNMNTLRKGYKHIVYGFLKAKSPSMQKVDNEYEDMLREIQDESKIMKDMAQLVEKAKKVELFKSDWQNNIAKVWAKQKTKMVYLHRK